MKAMRIKLTTTVICPFEKVTANFGEDLFNYLAPPPFIATSEKYEGEEIGNLIEMNFHLPFPGKWISEITSREETENRFQFEDRGVELPLGLSQWHHKHIVERIDNMQTRIIDDMQFEVKHWILRVPVYIGLYLGFAPRKGKYRSYFKKIE